MATKKKAAEKKVVASAKKSVKKKAVKTAPKKKTAAKKAAPKKKAAAGKKVATAVKKVAKKVAPGKKVAAGKKAAVAVKKIAKKTVKAVAKKAAPKKKAAAKKAVAVVAPEKKVAVAKTENHSVAKAIAKVAHTVQQVSNKISDVIHPKHETRNTEHETKKPLSRNQLKKSSAKKRSSERETLLDDTYTSNPKTPKTALPVDPKAMKLVKGIVNAIEEKKGDNIVCLDLRNIENRVCDYFIICDGNSSTQIEAIAGSVEFLVKRDLGERPYRSEGYENKTWILIDYVNVIVHVFDKETRYFYNLESLWADGEKISF